MARRFLGFFLSALLALPQTALGGNTGRIAPVENVNAPLGAVNTGDSAHGPDLVQPGASMNDLTPNASLPAEILPARAGEASQAIQPPAPNAISPDVALPIPAVPAAVGGNPGAASQIQPQAPNRSAPDSHPFSPHEEGNQIQEQDFSVGSPEFSEKMRTGVIAPHKSLQGGMEASDPELAALAGGVFSEGKPPQTEVAPQPAPVLYYPRSARAEESYLKQFMRRARRRPAAVATWLFGAAFGLVPPQTPIAPGQNIEPPPREFNVQGPSAFSRRSSAEELARLQVEDQRSNEYFVNFAEYPGLFAAIPAAPESRAAILRLAEETNPLTFDAGRIDALLSPLGLTKPEERTLYLAALAQKFRMPARSMSQLLKASKHGKEERALAAQADFLRKAADTIRKSKIAKRAAPKGLSNAELWPILENLVNFSVPREAFFQTLSEALNLKNSVGN